jgi:DNA-binding IclR family transcriptional regulator
MQVCPDAAKIPAMTPLTALSRSASGKTMLADLPPSSSEILASRSAAEWAMTFPTAVDPVKAILSTSG